MGDSHCQFLEDPKKCFYPICIPSDDMAYHRVNHDYEWFNLKIKTQISVAQ